MSPSINKVFRLFLSLNLEYADMDILRKYGKVQKGITREILVPANMTLQALHFTIQQAFGWTNEHLHSFSLPCDVFDQLTKNDFSLWSDYCGVYFRFFVNEEPNMEDWLEDQYFASENLRYSFRRRYKGPYRASPNTDSFYEVRSKLHDFKEQNPQIRRIPPFEEWIKMSKSKQEKVDKHPILIPLEKTSVSQIQDYLMEENQMGELLERLPLSEIFGDMPSAEQLEELRTGARTRDEYIRSHRDSQYYSLDQIEYLNGHVLPLTKELNYAYDYGDGWEINIRLTGEYSYEEALSQNQEASDSRDLSEKIIKVCENYSPVCISLDGLSVLDDVGGVYGFCDLLACLHDVEDSRGAFEDKESAREWARMQGWTGRAKRPETLL